jgi:hypothetical protein
MVNGNGYGVYAVCVSVRGDGNGVNAISGVLVSFTEHTAKAVRYGFGLITGIVFNLKNDK